MSARQKLTRLRRRLGTMARHWLGTEKVSYAQCGEDLIIDYLFGMLGVDTVRYLDIGAHHPTYLSNTYLFYRQGGHGVCVEPDPALADAFHRQRPRDRFLSVGIGPKAGTADFFVMTTPTLNTFSRAEAERYQSYGSERIEKVLQIPVREVNDVIATELGAAPDLLSLDVEGLDLPILESLDFGRFRPTALCVETLTYTEDGSEQKLTDTIRFLERQGYFVYADTYINSILVDRARWTARQVPRRGPAAQSKA